MCCWSPGPLCSAPLLKFVHVRKGEALAFHPSATSGEEQKALSPWGNVPGSGLGWDHPLLEPVGGFCEVSVSLLGWPGGILRKMNLSFFWWFRLLTSYEFRAFVSVGMSKISPWTSKCTETLLTCVKQQPQGCFKSLNFVPESPLQSLALNTSFSRNSLCSAAEFSALLSLLILVIMFHTGSLRRIIISFSGMQWTFQIHHFCALILPGKKITNQKISQNEYLCKCLGVHEANLPNC